MKKFTIDQLADALESERSDKGYINEAATRLRALEQMLADVLEFMEQQFGNNSGDDWTNDGAANVAEDIHAMLGYDRDVDVPRDSSRIRWLEEAAARGVVTTCFELEGGVFVLLECPGQPEVAAREVASVRAGIDWHIARERSLTPQPPLKRTAHG